ncbi:hypothetical protein Ahy_B05g075710 [Arachis hypogaea]|uniref:Protein FAR1-RELATED SEQUENCE n=1 Tax=Arachis hypogaea TaxID=3818 RepID=A0A444Z1T1_ARAHY|nr:hypothetical protein Ahy_B05g075710 [Arachis hypogaea]
MKKIQHKLKRYKRHEKIEQYMSHVVWNSFTKDAFNENWNDFLIKYGVGDNKWLSIRTMRNTQKSESMYAFF